MDAERLQVWRAELAHDPTSGVFLALVDALRRLGRLDEARQYAVRGLEQHPHRADAHDAYARVMADLGDEGIARDEWDFALRLDPSHEASLKGLGFLAYKRRDLATAERLLARALHVSPNDDGLATALRRVRSELRTGGGASRSGDAEVPPPSHPTRPAAPSREPPAVRDARRLFAELLGDGDRTALLLDRDGLVLAGAYVDAHGTEVADEVGAHLAGLAEESAHALSHLGLGAWQLLLVEAQHASVALAPAIDDAVVMVAAARDTQVGLVRRLAGLARARATAWMGSPA